MAGRRMRDLLVRITGDGAELEQELNRAARNLDFVGRRAERIGRDLSLKFTAPLMAAGAGIVALAGQAASYADEIDKTAIRTGIARDTLQELRFTTDQLGVSFQAVENAAGYLTRQMPELAKGTSDTAKALAGLGVSARGPDGQLRAMGDMLPDVIRRLSQMENVTERNALAARLLGSRYSRELIPLLDAGGEEIDRLMNRAQELGLVLSDQAIADLVEFKDAWSEVQQQVGAVGREFAMVFIPILKDQLIPFIRDGIVPQVRGWVGVLRELDPELIKSTARTVGLAAAIPPLLIVFGSTIRTVSSLLQLIRLLAGAKAALGTLLLPGGIVIAGLAILATGLARSRLEAIRAHTEIARLRMEIMLLSDAERAQRARGLREQFLENERAARSLREELERMEAQLEAMPGDGRVRGTGMGGQVASDPVQREANRLASQIAQRRRQLEELQAANREIFDELAIIGRQRTGTGITPGTGGTPGIADELEQEVDKVADIMDQLRQRLRIADELGELSDAFDATALRVSAYESALRDLVTLEERSPEAIQQVADELNQLRNQLARQSEEAKRRAEEEAEAQRELNEARQIYERLMAAVITPAERFAAAQDALNTLLREGEISQEEFTRASKQAEKALEEQENAARRLGRTWEEEVAQVLVASFTRVSGSFNDMARSILRDIQRMIMRLLVLRGLMAALSRWSEAGGFIGAVYSAVSAPFRPDGRRADGGPVSRGRSYLVGERGPELFVPAAAGRIVPNVTPSLPTGSAMLPPGGGRGSRGASPGQVAAEILDRVGPLDLPDPNSAAVSDYYRRLFGELVRDFEERS